MDPVLLRECISSAPTASLTPSRPLRHREEITPKPAQMINTASSATLTPLDAPNPSWLCGESPIASEEQ